MNDEELRRLIDEYLDVPGDPNPEMAGVQIVWERDDLRHGSKHIWADHGVTEQEVEEVLFEVPPFVEGRRHPEHPNRTVFWGATRFKRWIFVVCEDWTEAGVRYLKPITAFEPSEGLEYWERYR